MTMQPNILVTDGDERAALAVVRSLGKGGYNVFVTSRAQRSLAGASRCARGRFVVPDPLLQPRDFVEAIRRLVDRLGIDVVIPITDPSLLLLSRARDRLRATVPWPDADRVERLADKRVVMDAARSIGIAVPAQRVVATAAEAMAVAGELRFPLVLKPTRSVRDAGGGPLHKLVVSHAADAAELAARVRTAPDAFFPVLLQERIVGPGVGVSMLMRDGVAAATFCHRRLRERPPAGGVSVAAEGIDRRDAPVSSSVSLLRALEWDGVAMVEYKIDATSGVPYLMEINGRFWGSLQLAIDAGVDFPRLLVDRLYGNAATSGVLTTSARFRWWWGDVDHLLVRLVRSREQLSLPPDAPSRWRVIRDFVGAGWPLDDSIYRSDDRRPFLLETRSWLRRRLSPRRAATGATATTASGRSPTAAQSA